MELKLPDAIVAAELNQLLNSTVDPKGENIVGLKQHPQVEVPRAPWTIEDSEHLYRIQGWGEPYFSIDTAGHVTVAPQGDRGGDGAIGKEWQWQSLSSKLMARRSR